LSVSKKSAAELAVASAATSWSQYDLKVLSKAMHSVSSFLQSRHRDLYYPSYAAQSSEVLGVLKQLKDEMDADLSERQKIEKERSSRFTELQDAKTKEIRAGEKMEEMKEEELAAAKNNLAAAMEDLEQTQAALSESQIFMTNLKKTCSEADSDFEMRRNARLQEIKAVSDTIGILTGDDARDAMKGMYSFLQVDSDTTDELRHHAVQVLTQAAAKTKNPELLTMATNVELDAFVKVKEAIDNLVRRLRLDQEDEVEKSRWCKSQLQDAEMTSLKTKDRKADLEAKANNLGAKITHLKEEIATSKSQIRELQVELQTASANRLQENLDYQKMFEDQTMTIEVLHQASDRLNKYYSTAFAQTREKASQTPPIPQIKYKPRTLAGGVMSLIETLIHDAKMLLAEGKTAENAAEAAYESTVAETNTAIADLLRESVSMLKAQADIENDKSTKESDVTDATVDLEGLAKYMDGVHDDCDFLLSNFELRQTARRQEIQALQQAKQILSGAALS